MNCPVCNAFIEDENAKVCPCCNSNLKIAFQKQKVADAVFRNGEILDKAFKSKMFRVYAIIMSVICGLYALSVFYALPSEGIFSVSISYGLYLGFGIATLVGMWRLNCGKDSTPDKKECDFAEIFPVAYAHYVEYHVRCNDSSVCFRIHCFASLYDSGKV